MQGDFKVISLSYKNTPVEIREVIALDDNLIKSMLEEIRDLFPVSEALIISTCNRTEFYYSSETEVAAQLIQFLGLKKGIADMEQYMEHFQVINDPERASEHLFRVALGLEAQVVGDLQIINQVKRAYQMSADAQMAGPFLHRVLHTIFYANKRVFQETNFRNGAASVSYATSELVKTLAENLETPKILLLGLGEIGEDLARHMAETKLDVSITNRTTEVADKLGLECQLNVLPFDQLDKSFSEFDVVISSVAVRHFINPKQLANTEIKGIKYFVDLSIPRSIDPAIEDVKGVALYNIDEIQNNASAALNKRLAAIPDVEAIIADSLDDVNEWSMEMEVSPTIHKLKGALEQIRQDELKKHLKHASPEMEAFAEKLSKSLTQKIMKLPVLQLKAACKRGEAETLIDILNDLFDLENQTVKK
ncbi:glutamyl-tRNA reductase [Roseivirga pacifica]|uniref:glutamyl-tRNA reductase n=1 Tax=Roseivirga pacifica TaxID=1267423 RepID=UPI003BAA9107